MRTIRWMSLLLVLTLLTGCAGQGKREQKAERELFAMDTYMTVTCYGPQAEDACDVAETEIRRLDALLSVGNPDSEVSAINAAGGGELTADTKALMETALSMWQATSGAFDVTIYPLMTLLGFPTGDFSVPDGETLAAVRAHVGCDQIVYDPQTGTLTLAPDQGVDFGGIAKGYTSDRLGEVFAAYDLTGAIVSLGGNVCVYGEKPDGKPWRCGIQDPFAADGGRTLLGVLTAEDVSVITSGAYERFFTDEQGNVYHHILDPATGYPADSDLASVTIVSKSGIEADCLSTACYVMGRERAADLWRQSGASFDMILMTRDGTVYVTEPLRGSFTTDYPLRIIQ